MKKILLCIAMLLLFVGSFTACGNDTENVSGTYTITVQTSAGTPMEDIEVRVYADAGQADITAAGTTDENGQISFESNGAIGDFIYLEGVPSGYQLAENYELKEQNTVISLETELIAVEDLSTIQFELGSVFADMSVTTPDGTVCTISEILKEKKAVVINFWFLNCNPCRMEFPFMQQAYEEYQDDIEIIAVNPIDGTDETIAAFQEELGLTFPMAVCGQEWAQYLEIKAYPTTIVVDRYGMVGMIHTGTIPEKETFTKIFEVFTKDDYEPTVIKRMSELDEIE